MGYGIITPEEFTDTLTLTVDAKTKDNAALNYFEPTGEVFDNEDDISNDLNINIRQMY